jgi:Protein of unknown function (DUF1573)
MMTRLVLPICVFGGLVALVLLSHSSPVSEAGIPNDKISTASFRRLVQDIGHVHADSRTKIQFQISNDSTSTWTVASVRPDCGCLQSEISPNRIDAGQSCTLSLEYKAPEKLGVVNRGVLVRFREENAPAINCNIKGYVDPWCYASPPEIDFGTVRAGEESPTERTVNLMVRDDSAIDLAHLPRTADWVDMKIRNRPETNAQGKSFGQSASLSFKVKLSRDAVSGDYIDKLVFRGVGDPPQELSLPIRVRVEPLLKAVPDHLFLGTRKVGETVTTAIAISSNRSSQDQKSGIDNMEFTAAHNLGTAADIQLQPHNESATMTAVCRITMPDSEGFLNGQIEILKGKSRMMLIPVSARVTR